MTDWLPVLFWTLCRATNRTTVLMAPDEMITTIRTRIAHERLGEFPTPVMKMRPRSNDKRSDIWVKNDGVSSPHYGGNKVRKLEFAFATAKTAGATTVLTFGAVGSHHAVATTVHGHRVGLSTDVIVFDQPSTPHVRDMLRLDAYFGARLHHRPSQIGAALAVPRLIRKLRRRDGVAPYVLVPGASTPTGCIGYALAALELRVQIEREELPEPDAIFVAAGSCGTVAGLLAGAALLGWEIPLRAVRVVNRFVVNRATIGTLARATLSRLRDAVPEFFDDALPALPRYTLLHDYFGAGYGASTPAGRAAIEIARERTGLLLENSYTGKTFAALLDSAAKQPRARSLFWNTHNAADFSNEIAATDWHTLPRSLWKFFDGAVDA